MADPIATYGARVFARDGFRMSGDRRSGMKVTVRYRVDWSDAYAFLNAMVSPSFRATIGLITYTLPYSLPAAVAATKVYAMSFDVSQAGVRDDLTVATPLPYQGMAAGEYHRYGIVTIGFEQPTMQWDATDDPKAQNQLDPQNPIAMCEQAVKYHTKMVTLKGHKYRYASDGKAVVGDFSTPTYGADLSLRFPHVPYQPWQIGLPQYLNRVNSAAILLCDPGTLLFASPDTVMKPAMLGGPGMLEQEVTLHLRWNPDGWNKLPKPDGTLDDVVKAGGGSIYQTVDFRPLFNLLAFSQAATA